MSRANRRAAAQSPRGFLASDGGGAVAAAAVSEFGRHHRRTDALA